MIFDVIVKRPGVEVGTGGPAWCLVSLGLWPLGGGSGGTTEGQFSMGVKVVGWILAPTMISKSGRKTALLVLTIVCTTYSSRRRSSSEAPQERRLAVEVGLERKLQLSCPRASKSFALNSRISHRCWCTWKNIPLHGKCSLGSWGCER